MTLHSIANCIPFLCVQLLFELWLNQVPLFPHSPSLYPSQCRKWYSLADSPTRENDLTSMQWHVAHYRHSIEGSRRTEIICRLRLQSQSDCRNCIAKTDTLHSIYQVAENYTVEQEIFTGAKFHGFAIQSFRRNFCGSKFHASTWQDHSHCQLHCS